jgi:hypothetical protein
MPGGSGIFGMAVARAAEAMLRALGGAEISLVFPLLQMPNDSGAELGLMDPGVEEVVLSPVVARNLATSGTGPRRRLEFMVPAAVVQAEIVERNVATAQALFDGALGVMYAEDLLHIESVTAEYFAGTPYLYRVVAVE